MKKLRNIISLVAVCATTALFTGCGGDDDTVGGGGNNNPNSPGSLSGRTYNLTDSAGTGTLEFDAAAMNYTLTQGGNTETGTYTANRTGDVWVVNATDSTGAASTVTLNFTGNGTGNYQIEKNGQTSSGSFAASTGSTTDGTSTSTGTTDGTSTSTGTTDGTSTSTGTTDGTSTSTGTTDGTSTSTGTTDGTSTSTGTTTGTTGPVGTVPAPATLSSITVTTGAGGIGTGTVYTVTFSGGQSGTFTAVNSQGDSMGNGTYTYTPNGNQAQLRMDYPEFNNDFDDMTLFFTTGPGGGANQYTGTQRVSGTNYPMDGTFTY